MGTTPTPLVVDRPRSADEIAARLQRLLDPSGSGAAAERPLQTTLLRIAARQAEILTACLNAAPGLHLAAFNDFLTGRARPARPAEAVLVFRAAPGTAPVVVPMHTQVAAPAQGSDPAPVVFETRDDLALVRAEAVQACFVDAGHRQQADLAAMLAPAGRDAAVNPCAAAVPVPRAWHLAHRAAFGLAGLRELRLQLRLDPAADRGSTLPLEFGVATPTGFQPLALRSDTTDALAHDGELVFDTPPTWPTNTIGGIDSRWLTARPAAALATAAAPLPRIRSVTLQVDAATVPAPPACACFAHAPLDLSKDFFPLGERPRFGDVFELRSPAFDTPGAHVELQVRMTNPHVAPERIERIDGEGKPVPAASAPAPAAAPPAAQAASGAKAAAAAPAAPAAPVMPAARAAPIAPVAQSAALVPVARDGRPAPVDRGGKPVIVWEISTAEGFRALSAADGTRSLTADGTLTFTVPADVAATTIAGQAGVWLRGRLVSGDFGHLPPTTTMPIPVPRAPAIRTLSVASTVSRGPLAPECSVRDGALTRVVGTATGAPFDPFVAADTDGAALYLGLERGPGAAGPAFVGGQTIAVQVRAAAPLGPRHSTAPSTTPPRWQQSTPEGWRDVPVVGDSSVGLGGTGIVRLRPAVDAAPWPGGVLDPGARLAWLRLVWPAAADAAQSLPLGLALNAVPAVQSQRLRDEVIGSGNGRASQACRALRTPIVGAVRLQVRETDRDWVDWQEVEDFSASRPDARHYTLDRSNGAIVFGDGRHGRIPPVGPNNLRLHAYAVGGGLRGNCPARSITLLRTALPGVDAVTNPDAATGGIDAQGQAELQAHASAWLRHRDRAIGADDHAALALAASPEVARAWCVAGRDLAALPAAEDAEKNVARDADDAAGVVSVIVMPRSDDARPQPSLALLRQVDDHLTARRAPVGRLVVVGPAYAAVSVTLRYTPEPDASGHTVAAELAARVAAFLHPQSGGADGRGWAPGRLPHRSDLIAVAGSVDGVAVVRSVRLQVDAGVPGPAVVAAGRIDVAVAE